MEYITLEELQKADLRIGKIISAVPVEGSEKLLCLQISFGQETRQIVSGIAKFYSPEQLVGKECPCIVNLAPRMLKGLESQGMLLCADDNGPVLLHPEKEIAPGSIIK